MRLAAFFAAMMLVAGMPNHGAPIPEDIKGFFGVWLTAALFLCAAQDVRDAFGTKGRSDG